MRRRVLRRLLTPSVTPALASTSPFVHVLQIAASRAWTRCISSHQATPTGTLRASTVPPSRSTRSHDRPGSRPGFAPETFPKQSFATSGAHTAQSCSAKAEGERVQGGKLVKATTCTTKYTPNTPTAASSSTTSQKTVHGTFHRDTDCGNHQIGLVADGPRNSKLQGADIPEVPANTAPRLLRRKKSALIPQRPVTTILPAPTSQQTLYDNLRLSLNLKPLPKLPALIDYHDSYPKFRSTNSYNFLIELSIRHTQFGATHWLFDAMIQDKIPRDLTTRRLSIRWLVRTGRWEQAWTQITRLTPDEALDKPLRNGLTPVTTRIPWYMWQELLFTSKRGALRRTRDVRWSTDEDGNTIRLPTLEVINDPPPGTEAYLRRQRLLACVQPVLDSGVKGQKIRPNLVKNCADLMIREGRAPMAVDLVKVYFSTLPLKIRRETASQCIDIIHSLLSADTGNGLASMYTNRRLLVSLLEMHPSFKPSSTSLFLLLSPLKRAKKGGTVAFNVIKAFRKSWGADVVDIRVRRRVGSLAKKEGRMDIAQAMLNKRGLTRIANDANPSSDTAVLPTMQACGLRRPPDRELFLHVGTERQLWTRFKLRAR